MARKKPVKKKTAKRASKAPSTPARKASGSASKAAKKVVKKKPAAARKKAAPAPAPAAPAAPARKKGVRKATIASGIRVKKAGKKLGRSRIPIDAPLDVVFQNEQQAREAFEFLGIHTIRELEQINPDDLVMRLTSPAKKTVGRIRMILAMNNRCLQDDELFALEYQERQNQTPGTR
ncbi:MAG: hypothetical protein KDA96_06980 [Planctomycetaceae bacterium]|nr:hypothetical protein [Planctomycetaceae bacterium]